MPGNYQPNSHFLSEKSTIRKTKMAEWREFFTSDLCGRGIPCRHTAYVTRRPDCDFSHLLLFNPRSHIQFRTMVT